MDLSDAIVALTEALDETGAPAMLIGGIAVIARGIPRHTDDVDGTISGEALDLEEIVRILKNHDIEPRVSDAIEFARQHQVLLLVHTNASGSSTTTANWCPTRHPPTCFLGRIPHSRQDSSRWLVRA